MPWGLFLTLPQTAWNWWWIDLLDQSAVIHLHYCAIFRWWIILAMSGSQATAPGSQATVHAEPYCLNQRAWIYLIFLPPPPPPPPPQPHPPSLCSSQWVSDTVLHMLWYIYNKNSFSYHLCKLFTVANCQVWLTKTLQIQSKGRDLSSVIS